MAAIVIGLGSFFLSLALVVNAVALLVPYWLETGSVTKGLWGQCTCSWNFENWDGGHDTDWFKASKGLYTAGVALIVVAVLLVLAVTCCCSDRGGAKCYITVGVLLIIAFLATAVAIILYGVKQNQDNNIGIDTWPRFGWALWLGVAGSILALITGIMYICQVRVSRD